MPDPNLAGMSGRSRKSTRPARHWIVTLDSARLRQARTERGLSRDKLAAEAGVSRRTMARLESGPAASCHRATLYRIAASLGDDPVPVITALTGGLGDEAAAAPGRRPEVPGPVLSWQCSRTFTTGHDQIPVARAFLGRVLHGCPMTFEAQLICTELMTNAVLHSRSARPGGRFVVRAEVREHDYIWLEVEDQGGIWTTREQPGQGGRGLQIVAALSDYWDIKGDDDGRIVCSRIDWPGPGQ